MIVQCPGCDTRYNLDDEKIGSKGAKVRCTRCQYIFQLSLPSEQFIEDTVDEVFSKAPSFLGGSQKGENSLDGDAPPSRGKRIVLWLVLLLVLLGGTGAGIYYYDPHLLDNFGINLFTGNIVEEQQEKKDVVIPEITLENVRQYFVKNEKIGQVFVVEGKAVNGFKVPKELIKLRIKLFDKAGKTIASKVFLCGNTVSYFQLQVLKKEELESALSAKLGILTNNTNLKPGASVPFMVVFPEPAKELDEFSLEPIEVKDPPK